MKFYQKTIFEENQNNFSLLINQKSYIKVYFYSFDEKLISGGEYSLYKTLQEIIIIFLKKETEEKLKEYLNNGLYFSKNNLEFYIKTNDKFEKIQKNQFSFYNQSQIEKNKYNDSQSTSELLSNKLKIYIKNPIKYKHFAKNIEDYIINNAQLIGKPILNEYEYYLYNKIKKQLKIIKYHSHQIKKFKIKRFSTLSSYCNAKNYLYIYEGNNDLDNYFNNNNFFQINLINNNINLISSDFPNRFLYSMIYIPEKYIFIIGGKNTKNVITYKIKKNNNSYDLYPHELPYELLEPSLIYINNKYLYAFENSIVDFHILCTNFINVEPFKEINISNNNYYINQKFFGVVKCKNSILFLGGQMLDLFQDPSKKCFFYNYIENKMERDIRDFKSFEFSEKTFIPLEKGIYFQIAIVKKVNKYEPKLIFFKDEIKNIENNTIINI